MPISTHDLQKSRGNLPNSAIGCAPIVLGTKLSKPSRAIYVGTSGNLILNFADGSRGLFLNLPIGTHSFAITMAETTSGAAADLMALF